MLRRGAHAPGPAVPRGRLSPWCVVKGQIIRRACPTSELLRAALLQRVRVPPRQASEHRVAGPRRRERSHRPERGVESRQRGDPRVGSKHAGRNMK